MAKEAGAWLQAVAISIRSITVQGQRYAEASMNAMTYVLSPMSAGATTTRTAHNAVTAIHLLVPEKRKHHANSGSWGTKMRSSDPVRSLGSTSRSRGRGPKSTGKVRMLAEGSAVCTKALGLEFDLVARGMGSRS